MKKKKITGLFFGSFNPIHIGHMAIANYLVEYGKLDEIWFVVSPHNPLKEKKSLLNGHHRLMMVKEAIEGDTRFRARDIEFKMPQPSYTIDTLTFLTEQNPEKNFCLIVGSDSIASFKKWKNFETILSDYSILVYPRPGDEESEFLKHPNVKLVEAPRMDVSSSFIRKAIADKKDVRHFVSERVWKYMEEMGFYK
ncbi:MAG: nicotinate (nicotinamide) nucleotide adenylyltransferase [Bacteroidota bacterium]